MNEEFYIGWQSKAPPRLGRWVRRTALCLLVALGIVAALLAYSQRTIGVAVFEWGDVKPFAGKLELHPYPHLLVRRPGRTGPDAAYSTYLLVAPLKFGLDADKFAALAGKNITLKGTLIYRGNQTMVEAQPDTIQAATNAVVTNPGPAAMVDLGVQTLVGEIVDSKCFLGVMNPGALEPHRDCAVRCISGGIPPMLVVRQRHGAPLYLLLVSAEGVAVNQQVLDWVAEPVQITGEIVRQDNLLILRADPSTYRRIN